MKLTKEQNRIKAQKYRAKYPEKVRTYDRARYRLRRAEVNRMKAMGDRKCRSCEIFLASKMGGFGTKYYCRDCVERGFAQKHMHREATKKWRAKKEQLSHSPLSTIIFAKIPCFRHNIRCESDY